MLIFLLLGVLMGAMESSLVEIHSKRSVATWLASFEVWRAVVQRVAVHSGSVMFFQLRYARAGGVAGVCHVVVIVKWPMQWSVQVSSVVLLKWILLLDIKMGSRVWPAMWWAW